MTDKRRVVVTGIGLRTPIGHSLAELREAFTEGRTGVRAMPEWREIENLRTGVAGVCTGVEEGDIPRHFRRSMGRVAILAALSAADAVRDAGLDAAEIASPACGVSFGSTAGSSQAMEDYLRQILATNSLKGLQSSVYIRFMSHTCAANLATMFRTQGPVIASCTACVSGSQGVGFGYEQIRAGRAEIMITGGAEEMHSMDAGIFDVMRATSTHYNDRPEQTPRPFDRRRDGLVVGEGSGCLILESYQRAHKRGAAIHAEIIGFGNNCDGGHITNPSAEGMAGAMRLALEDAGIRAEDVGHVHAHATATELGDIAESRATHDVFGARVPVSAVKGYMGHTLGACGAIESAVTILMLKEGLIVPTRNLEEPDPACAPLNHVTGGVREHRFRIGMNNNFAFGGINTSLLFSLV
ncbi:MAG: beta-ketoacyl synthase N-terminal-like domain-containing protein [Deltaproteobacteria bacterium]|nr:beta-ketoacyl synthase N-terminal-like domain-containing protein [Deltaproteobacteria bacterium]